MPSPLRRGRPKKGEEVQPEAPQLPDLPAKFEEQYAPQEQPQVPIAAVQPVEQQERFEIVEQSVSVIKDNVEGTEFSNWGEFIDYLNSSI